MVRIFNRVRPFTHVFLLRSAGLWFGVRAGTSLILALAGLPLDAVSLLIAVPLITAILGVKEARRRNEVAFLANLGVSPWIVGVLCLLPALLLEAGFLTLQRL